MLEVEPIQRAIKDKVAAYETDEFGACRSKRDLDYVRKIWDQGNAMDCLIFGGFGYIGSRLLII